MSYIPFPSIPEVQDGMIVSSSALNVGFNLALYKLLGESHRYMPAAPYWEANTTSTSWFLAGEEFVYLTSLTLHYIVWMRNNTINKNFYWLVQMEDKDEILRTLLDEISTGTDWTKFNGTINLANVGGYDYTANFPLNKVYKVKFSIRTTDGGRTYIAPWGGLWVRNSITGWIAPHNFGIETSAAAHFNDMRTDILKLRNQLPIAESFTHFSSDEDVWYNDTDIYTATEGVYRYRVGGLYASVKTKWKYAGSTYKLRVCLADSYDGGTYDVDEVEIYLSGAITSAEGDCWDEIYLTSAQIQTALDNAGSGITLTLGDYYYINAQITRESGSSEFAMREAFLGRYSNGTPHGDWSAPNVWACSDTDFGPTELNKLRDNLQMFYMGGAEKLFGETNAVRLCPSTSAGTPRFSAMHRKRWLYYLTREGGDEGDVFIGHGVDCEEEYNLNTDVGWHWLDLTTIKSLAFGTYYIVKGVNACFEVEGVYA